MTFVNQIETNPHTIIVPQYISLSSGMWSNLLRKTAIETTFYFPAEEQSICIKKKSVSVNSTGHDLYASFCNTCGDFHMGKTPPPSEKEPLKSLPRFLGLNSYNQKR